MSSPAQVLRAYYLICALYTGAASLIWGVNTLFLLQSGLSLFEVFVANGIFTGAMAFFEIPTGVYADTTGRRASFLVSVAILCIGTLGYVAVGWMGYGVLAFSLVSIFLGLGYTFYSGAVEAWLVDALDATGYEAGTDRVFARGAFVSSAAMLLGSVAGGVLGSVDLALPFLVRAGLLVAVFGIAFVFMRDLGFTPRKATLAELPREMKRIAAESVRFGWQVPGVRWMMLAAAVPSLFTAWAFHAWQPYFLELLGKDAAWVAGVIAALVSVSTMVGNSVVDRVTRYCGKRTTLMLWAAGGLSLFMAGVGLIQYFWIAVPLYLLANVCMGVFGPVKQAFLHRQIESEQRATVISFASLVGSGASMTGQGGLGWFIQTRGIGAGYIVSGGLALLLGPFLLKARSAAPDADAIVGDKASPWATCAAQGLPDVAGVDQAVVVEGS